MDKSSGDFDLEISASEADAVVISRCSTVSNSDWARVLRAFGFSTQLFGEERKFQLDVLLFQSRAQWLRVWESEGKTLRISDGAKRIVKRVLDERRGFEALLAEDPVRFKGSQIVVPGLTRALTVQQSENIQYLLAMPNGCNFSVPGAGKTLTTLALWRLLREQQDIKRLLVVCPRSAMRSWAEEARRSFADPPAVGFVSTAPFDPGDQLLLVNYEQLENPEKLQRLEKWLADQKSHLVVDEAHRVKGGGASVRWRACRALSSVAARVDLLTGTPMPNSASDLVALFQLAWPRLQREALSPDRQSQFQRGTVFVRTTKKELGLPRVSLHPIIEPPSQIQREILDALRQSYAGRFGLSQLQTEALARRGKAVMTLLAAATNPGLLVSRDFSDVEFGFSWPPRDIQEDIDLSSLINEYLKYETPWKYRKAAEIVAKYSAQGEKVIVWSSFIGNIAAMKWVLRKFAPSVVYGATTAELREAEIDRFIEDPKCTVLLTNPQTLGEGISLHESCHASIYLDRTFNAGQYLQSLDRIHRLGLAQDDRTDVYLLQTENSIDVRVSKRLERKIQDLSSFLDDASLALSSIPSLEEQTPDEALGLSDEDFSEIMSYLSDE